jgi:hypothetical protein
MRSELIDSVTTLATVIDGLGDCEGEPPSLYMDLEGNNLTSDPL